MRTLGDSWVVCRKSGHRRFFVVLNQKSANFAEINGEIHDYYSRMCTCIPSSLYIDMQLINLV